MQGAYSKNKKYQLPRPYGLKPKDNRLPRSYLTTPMKKMIGYLVLLFAIGSCIYFFGPSKDDSDDMVLSLETAETDNFVNTAASAKKNAKLTVDQVFDDTVNIADAAGAQAGAAAIIDKDDEVPLKPPSKKMTSQKVAAALDAKLAKADDLSVGDSLVDPDVAALVL